MRTSWSDVLMVVGTACAVACAQVKQKPGETTGAGGVGGGGHGGLTTDGPPPPVDGIVINTAKCGNGLLDAGESDQIELPADVERVFDDRIELPASLW